MALRPRATRSHLLPLLAVRRSPRPRTLPPPAGDECIVECDRRGGRAQERDRKLLAFARRNHTLRGGADPPRDINRPDERERARSTWSGQHDQVVAVDDLVR